jgi:intracellular sulfur oxidation DsrE/DsrF family protein
MNMLLTAPNGTSNFTKKPNMEKHILQNETGRRQFIGKLTAGAATLGMAGLLTPLQDLRAERAAPNQGNDPDEYFKKMTGKHRIIYDVIRSNGILPFLWPRAFLLTNQATGSDSADCNVVVVLRHEGIPYAFNTETWQKYNFGEVFKADDPVTKKPSMRNPFWKPAKGEYSLPGIGVVDIGINELQDSGVLFCVCSVAMAVYSAAVAQGMKMDPEQVKKDWMAGLLPGVQVMPSGVWAVGRAQEHGCSYCYAS